MAVGGDAVAHDGRGRVVLVDGALPGETVDAAVYQQHTSYARAVLVTVVSPSPEHVGPPCPHVARGCGGCGWQHTFADRSSRVQGGGGDRRSSPARWRGRADRGRRPHPRQRGVPYQLASRCRRAAPARFPSSPPPRRRRGRQLPRRPSAAGRGAGRGRLRSRHRGGTALRRPHRTAPLRPQPYGGGGRSAPRSGRSGPMSWLRGGGHGYSRKLPAPGCACPPSRSSRPAPTAPRSWSPWWTGLWPVHRTAHWWTPMAASGSSPPPWAGVGP